MIQNPKNTPPKRQKWSSGDHIAENKGKKETLEKYFSPFSIQLVVVDNGLIGRNNTINKTDKVPVLEPESRSNGRKQADDNIYILWVRKKRGVNGGEGILGKNIKISQQKTKKGMPAQKPKMKCISKRQT